MRGLDLELMRRSRRVKVGQIAREMGVTSSRVSHIEAQDIVTERATVRYLEALSRFPELGRAA